MLHAAQVAQPFLLRGVPVERVDVRHEFAQGGGFADEGTGVRVDHPHEGRGALAQVQQRLPVVVQPVGRGGGLQGVPAVLEGDVDAAVAAFFLPGLLGHLQEQQVGQFRDVLVERDAVVTQVVAEVPEFLDDVDSSGHEYPRLCRTRRPRG